MQEWFASLAEEERLAPESLSTYASSLRHHHVEQSLRAGVPPEPNPLDDGAVQRVLSGAKRLLAQAKVVARRGQPEKEPPPGVRLAHLDRDRDKWLPAHAGPLERMTWAALRCAIDGMLRPNEFLGSKDAGKNRGPMELSQLQFYDEDKRPLAQEQRGVRPAYFTMDLGITKTDVLAKLPPKVLRDQETVRALWAWLRERRALGESRRQVFAFPGHLLSGAELKKACRRECSERFSLKCYRRGGAAERIARGEPIDQVRAQGAWRTAGETMPRLYGGAAAFAERAILLSASSATRLS